jgi:hypothetical protein
MYSMDNLQLPDMLQPGTRTVKLKIVFVNGSHFHPSLICVDSTWGGLSLASGYSTSVEVTSGPNFVKLFCP